MPHPPGDAELRQREIERVQAEHRQRILEAWNLPPGSRVLEVGCGQGDMTAVLARAVGPSGHVTAVDLAGPDYGAPQTLGEATSLLKASPVGAWIDFRFHCDLLNGADAIAPDTFDGVVLAHSSWYFASLDQLAATLRTVRGWSRRLYFAEWDLQPHSLEQLPHLLAVLIQGQVEAFTAERLANVRTPLTRGRLLELLAGTGWKVVAEGRVDARGLQDGDWEIAAALAVSSHEAGAPGLPGRAASFLKEQRDLLRQIASPTGNASLDCYAIVAERSEEAPDSGAR